MASSETAPLLQPDATESSAREENARAEPRGFARNLGAIDGFALLISIVIGSGVFSSPGSIDANVPSPGAALLIWLVGGILAWTGALTMAELGTAFPGEGGIQPYLSHMYGEVWGYMAAWSWIVATMPATLAILSIVFVESIYSSMGINEPEPPMTHKLLSLLVLVSVTTLNSISTKTSTRLSGFFVAIKLLTILLLIVAGLVAVFIFAGKSKDYGGGDWHKSNWFTSRDTVLPDGSRLDWSKVTTWESLGYYSTALYGALWAYSGWDKANYISSELRNVVKQLPLSINTAIPTIIICYIAANTVYYVLLPWKIVSTTDAAAVTAVAHFLGKGAAYFATALICLVIAGSALGNSFVAGRMTVAASNKNWFPRVLGTVGQIGTLKVTKAGIEGEEAADEAMDKGESPINALVLNTVLSAVYILMGNMRILLTLNGLAEYAFFFLTVLGAIILRYREPDLNRPVKPFILIPILFALISGFVVIRGAVFAPVQAALLVAIWLLGAVLFYLRKWIVSRQ
ncbi:amino acid transporter [Dothidotthia symphoricarpi CBS 119687]|uniref:Amino acid transporter n=1 Tax=Dothidotthia symphoricarpi CBS 119687 TaxID=1392245 RepID=A0A6A6ACK8_9PLEO|nr:amino acid transporter [Dothidotthia symphoricarpi CBS 119687]KAF2129316.1 amino acid transporter [Dothidotthia symphoricarpi CBS 119687]